MVLKNKEGVELWQAVPALFLGGFATYSLLYCVQPLLPIFAAYFDLSPSMASLSLSLTLAGVLLGMLLIPKLSKKWGRKNVMASSLFIAAILEAAVIFSTDYWFFLAARAGLGLVLAGFPANAMAYVAEEFPPHQAAAVMGLYISGTAVGGMFGRLLAGWLTEWYSWRVALLGLAGIAFFAAMWFSFCLPRSRNQGGQGNETLGLLESLGRAASERKLIYLYLAGFLLLGAFVTLFNYIPFLLMSPPYSLTAAAVGSLFILNAVGTMTAPLVGRLAARFSPAAVLAGAIVFMFAGALATLCAPFVLKLVGMTIFSGAFAANHSTISAWVGRCATFDKAQASAWYLIFYYAGSITAGTAGGQFWLLGGWEGVIAFVSGLLGLAFAIIAVNRKRLEKESKISA
jgi:YNFM family putative membrane transporter